MFKEGNDQWSGEATYDYLNMVDDVESISTDYDNDNYVATLMPTIDGSRYIYRIKSDDSWRRNDDVLPVVVNESEGESEGDSGEGDSNEGESSEVTTATPGESTQPTIPTLKTLVLCARISAKYIAKRGVVQWEFHVENPTDRNLPIDRNIHLVMDGIYTDQPVGGGGE